MEKLRHFEPQPKKKKPDGVRKNTTIAFGQVVSLINQGRVVVIRQHNAGQGSVIFLFFLRLFNLSFRFEREHIRPWYLVQ